MQYVVTVGAKPMVGWEALLGAIGGALTALAALATSRRKFKTDLQNSLNEQTHVLLSEMRVERETLRAERGELLREIDQLRAENISLRDQVALLSINVRNLENVAASLVKQVRSLGGTPSVNIEET